MALTTVSNAGLGGSIDLTAKVTGTLPIANGGTNSTSTTYCDLTANVTGTMPAGNGGTGATTYTPGKVLQVIQGQKDGNITTTSTSYVTTGLTADITPSSSSNKVLVLVNNTACHQAASNKNGYFTVYRDTTNIAPGGSGLYEQLSGVYIDTSASTISCPISMLDSPSSTSSLTYTVYFATDSSGTQGININGTSSVIQLLEVAG
jgi:hypothetical protein